MRVLRSLTTSLLDLVFPTQCHFCGQPQEASSSLCPPCSEKLPRVHAPFCQDCGESFDGAIERAFSCPNCSQLDYQFDFARSPLLASDEAKELIHHFKYSRQIHLARDLAKITSECENDPRVAALLPHSILIPVPLHLRREQWRHFNQAQEIAHFLAKEWGIPHCNALKRVAKTIPQARLSRRARLTNLKNAFMLRSQHQTKKLRAQLIKRPNLILIDDVFTTGATSHECARTLKALPEVEKVIVLTAMRG